jgi:hypothetical protein
LGNFFTKSSGHPAKDDPRLANAAEVKVGKWPDDTNYDYFLFKRYSHPIPWRDSISRPIAPVSSVAGGDDTTWPRRLQGNRRHWSNVCSTHAVVVTKVKS